LARRIVEEAALRERFVVEAAATMADRQACLEAATATQAPTGIRWRGEAVAQYERTRERFQEKLLMRNRGDEDGAGVL
jgi:hypothetical protein